MLDDAQVRTYAELGCLVVPGFFSALEVEALQHDVERMIHYGLTSNAAEVDAGKESLELWGLDRYSSLVRALPFESRLLEAVGQLIASPLALHASAFIIKPARTGRGTRWHADDTHGQTIHPNDKAIGVWIALHDVSVDNGPLEVVPGSRRFENQYVPDTEILTKRPMTVLSPAQEAAVERVMLKAGGLVFFSYNTLHRTLDNRSDADRAALTIHFVSADQFAPDFPGGDARHPYLTGPLATGGKLEYGADQRGRWSTEVALRRAWRAEVPAPDAAYSYSTPVTLRTVVKVTDDNETLTRAAILVPTGLRSPMTYDLDAEQLKLVQAIDGASSYEEILETIEDGAPLSPQSRRRLDGLTQFLVECGILATP